MSRSDFLCGALIVGVITAACQSSVPETAAKARVQSEYDQSGRLARLMYDRDGDGKVDTWGFMDGARVVRVEVDENGDGQVDRWEYHTTGSQGAAGANGADGATGAGANGVETTVERIDRSTRHDGRVSRQEFFDHGVLTRVEEDTDGDGKIDKWETYTAGALAVLALDSKGRGTPDRRLIYEPDGTLGRIESDPNGTGTFQPISR